jgi:hypothetical protein
MLIAVAGTSTSTGGFLGSQERAKILIAEKSERI